jgi:F-type H+-transporting ATPase subunit b
MRAKDVAMTTRPSACETERKLQAPLSRCGRYLLVALLTLAAPTMLAAQPPETPAQQAPTGIGAATGASQEKPPADHEPASGAPAQETHAAEAEHTAEGEHGEEHGGGLLDMAARLVNFGILAGTLIYLLKSPVRTYLADRSVQIRSDLVNAAEMKEAAAAQIAQIERKMQALPGELEALRTQGGQEITAEETRIRAAAAAERERLLEQARREIDLQVKVAERSLVAHAADLAVGVAAERIKKNITDDDQKRLVDRYVQQLHE